MNKEQKAHNLSMVYANFFIEHNLEEYYDESSKTFNKNLILSDLSSTYDEGYKYFSKN